ncbi:hypothetical protein SJAG_03098 [Schizosaccharomyces japonicus yFS275]|uniref:Short chain dehydrogenase n=1 Tax=Schizosaccharomyces japonicus (strain yFS275 / FY16936) TaxID=402676 RepID=B6K3B4_SCHJY|nr:hypothetical protein SJAG_03098 [Schizosaccharomyces japonicus yFS275]EEB07971.1 hypothetical protein SJAG_03098 [Schizosaccharomyces japonicus yFS275]
MSDQKVVLLTGASRGIGLCAAAALVKQARVVTVSRTMTHELEDLLKANSDKMEHVQGDVCTCAKEAVQRALDRFGRLDSVILNAGVVEPIANIAEADMQEWRKLFDVNFFSVVEMVKEALPYVRKQKGSIVIVSSGAAVHILPAWAAYCCSKAAINMLVQNLGSEEPDVMSVALRPGAVDTSMQDLIREERNKNAMGDMHDFFKNLKATGKLVNPEDIGKALTILSLQPTTKLSGQFVDWKTIVHPSNE